MSDSVRNLPFQRPAAALTVLPGWDERLRSLPEQESTVRPQPIIPRSLETYATAVTYVADADAAEQMRQLILQRPVAWVGIDFEFCYSRPGVLMKRQNGRDHYWQDPGSIQPLLMSLTWVEPADDGLARLLRFVVDVRQDAALPLLTELLRLPIPHIAHFVRAELTCLWALDLRTPDISWDTWVAERAMDLGRHHAKYEQAKGAEEIEAGERAEQRKQSRYGLESTCRRRGVAHPLAGDKQRLQRSFLEHGLDEPFSREQIEYAAADATAAALLYPVQVQTALLGGCLQHLESVEMPWAVTNALMEWHGVRADRGRIEELRAACERHVARLSTELAENGLANVNSHLQVKGFFERLGLLHLFETGNKYTFDDNHLEAAEAHHPAIGKIRTLRRIQRLRSDQLLTGELVGADGRLHPEHRQLGSDSGRNSMRWPNIGGIGRALRPVVVPDAGNAIGEVDLSQIEVGIAAAFYGDPELIEMFNGHDVYVAMTKKYYAHDLPEDAMDLADPQFKKQYGHLRDRMKIYTLGIIYGMTGHGLAKVLNIPHAQAEREQQQFMAMFPILNRALHEAIEFGAIRGYAYTCSGLRRYRAKNGRASSWERNWLRNTPVQGSAGVVFKVAGNRLRRRYEHYGAKLIMPLHDAYIFECREEHLQKMAKITAETMRATVQEYFPQLDPMAEINIDAPHCWNKDGKERSLRLWLADPMTAMSRA